MVRIPPAFRIAFALVALTVSMLVTGDLFGLIPDRRESVADARKQVSESLALQFSQLARQGNEEAIRYMLDSIVLRSDDIVSAGIRKPGGDLAATFGEHRQLWESNAKERSTLSHVQVPVFRGGERWATVEVRFKDVFTGGLIEFLRESLIGLFIFVSLMGFLVYALFLRRALRELDPSSVIPDRVRSAFDVMAEGVMILDEQLQIVLANQAFANRLDQSSDELIGRRIGDLRWQPVNESQTVLPWQASIEQKKRQVGVPVWLEKSAGERFTFMVNSGPILDSGGHSRGVLITLDDMTVLEQKNGELQHALTQLRMTKEEIVRQNEELRHLAMRDSLTGALNRRAFFAQFDDVFSRARKASLELCCLMIDIDHFKSVNDNYGHAIGDQVIKMVARILTEQTRDHDLVGRYGGEEFSVILPGLTIESGAEVGERIRRVIRNAVEEPDIPITRLTVSIGVATIQSGHDQPGALLEHADEALYVAKETGRNRVVRADRLSQVGHLAHTITDPEIEPGREPASVEGDSDQDLMTRVVQLERLAEERRRALEYQSLHDEHTGLPNNVLLIDRINQAIERGRRERNETAVVSIYLETVERISQAYDEPTAEILLIEAANRLQKQLRSTDTVATLNSAKTMDNLSVYRVSSSEIGILLTDLTSPHAVVWIMKRLDTLLRSEFEVEGEDVFLDFRIGAALSPQDGYDAELLLRHARTATRSAPVEGAGQMNFYSADMAALLRQQISIESQLHHALENDEFVLHYQPKVEIGSGRILSLEALIRWRHPEQGMIYPGDFIPVAERSGLIKKIGDWVVRRACQQIKEWQSAGHLTRSVAVNVSPNQFTDTDFGNRVEQILNEIGIAPELLEVEITESTLISGLGRAVSTIRSLAALGVRIFMDDFGTGYSSLSNLKHLPIDAVKIDRSFLVDIVDQKADQAIVSAVVAMAHSLDIKVVAEGVETAEQLVTMHELGCDEVQGFLFGKPAPAVEISRMSDSIDLGGFGIWPDPTSPRREVGGGG